MGSSPGSAGRGASWRSATRTRTRTRLGRPSRSSGSWRRWAARPTRSARMSRRRCTRSCPASSGSGPTRTCRRLRPAGHLGLRGALAGRRCGRPPRGPVRGLPRVIVDHHASNDAAEAGDWIEPDPRPRARWSTLLAARLGVPLTADDGALARISWRASSWTPRPSPTPTPRRGRSRVAAALVEAGAPLSDISRRLYRTKPEAQLGCSGGSSSASRASDDGGSCGPRSPTPTSRRRGDRRPLRGIIDLLSQSDAAEVAILFKEAGGRDADQRPHEARRRRCDRADRHVRWAAGTRGRPARASMAPLDAARDGGRRGGAPARRRRPSPGDGARSRGPGLDGILVVDKPAGPTSHDVVALIRRLAATKRVGHGGTLDPFAGASCRSSSATGRASSSTTSATRRRIARRSASAARRPPTTSRASSRRPRRRRRRGTAVEAALAGMVGVDPQRPPAYSAIKVGGRRAYAMARAGETRRARRARGDAARAALSDWDGADPERPIAIVDVTCSAGTYVRALARDLGVAVGSAAYLGALTPDGLGAVRARRRRPARRDPGGGRRWTRGLLPILRRRGRARRLPGDRPDRAELAPWRGASSSARRRHPGPRRRTTGCGRPEAGWRRSPIAPTARDSRPTRCFVSPRGCRLRRPSAERWTSSRASSA